MKVAEAVESFVLALQAEGTKPVTQAWYRFRLAGFLRMYGQKDVKDLTIDDIRAFIVRVQSQYDREYTRFGIIRTVRRVFKWLYEEHKIPDAIYRQIKLPTLPQGLPKAVEMADVTKLLLACGTDAAGKRDRAIILFLLDTGCRVGGMCSLTKDHLDFKNLRATIHEKGNKDRVVLFGANTAKALKEWMIARPYQDAAPVFISMRDGRPMNAYSVGLVLHRLKSRTDIKGRVNPHAFRHAFAREYLQNGGRLDEVSKILGHTQIGVTAKFYAVFQIEELRDHHHSFSPASKLK